MVSEKVKADNEQRAKNAAAVLSFYWGEKVDVDHPDRDEIVQDLLTELMHFWPFVGLEEQMKRARMNWLAERRGDDLAEDADVKPLALVDAIEYAHETASADQAHYFDRCGPFDKEDEADDLESYGKGQEKLSRLADFLVAVR